MRLLLVEDEPELAAVVQSGLTQSGYSVEWVERGSEALERLSEGGYALVLLDVMLPDTDGWQVCETLRRRRDPVPVLMLTARDSVEDRVHGLESGADDYLPKPFDFRELRARVRALLRRERTNKGKIIEIGDLVIDTERRQVRRAEREIPLSQREYTLLEALAAREGTTVSREMVLERVWEDTDTASNTVEVYISSLRRKVDGDSDIKLIRTIHGQGYRMDRPAPLETIP
ncbi:MAG: response regulator transcription factor [Fibrella sp.]|nr:response regulator transcription factor [Armatimonadota bacterium]